VGATWAGPAAIPLPTSGDEAPAFGFATGSSRAAGVVAHPARARRCGRPGVGGFFVGQPRSVGSLPGATLSSSSSFPAGEARCSSAQPRRRKQRKPDCLGAHGARGAEASGVDQGCPAWCGRWRPMGLAPDPPRIGARPSISGEAPGSNEPGPEAPSRQGAGEAGRAAVRRRLAAGRVP